MLSQMFCDYTHRWFIVIVALNLGIGFEILTCKMPLNVGCRARLVTCQIGCLPLFFNSLASPAFMNSCLRMTLDLRLAWLGISN
jgi:hypothetical protein